MRQRPEVRAGPGTPVLRKSAPTVAALACTAGLVAAGGTGCCTSDAQCQDGKACNGSEWCDWLGLCNSGDPVTCDDGVNCTTDMCVEPEVAGGQALCSFEPDDSACDDGLFCTGAESCDVLSGCQAGTPACDDGVGCTEDLCEEGSGACSHDPDDVLCDDFLFCDGSETCSTTEGCLAGAPPVCDDGVDCTTDSCDETDDRCVAEPDDSRCDDAAYCNGEETCDPTAGCRDGVAVACDDDVACTTDACDELADACSFMPVDTACDDEVSCTVDTCELEEGCFHRTDDTLCDDHVACTVDTCDPTGGCSSVPDDALCDDSNECTSDRCTGTACESIPVEDGTPCTFSPDVPGVCRGGECIPSGCGNDLLEPGEECDPGPPEASPHLGCSATCRSIDFVVSDPPEFVSDDGREEVGPADRSVAVLEGGGRFVVVWTQDQDVDPKYADVRAQVLDVTGGTFGPYVEVTETAMPQQQPVVAALPGGGFAVAYEGYGDDPDGEDVDVYLVVYRADGALVRSTRANTTVGEAQLNPTMAVSPADGTIVVAWEDWSRYGEGIDPWSLSGIRYRLFKPDGTPDDDWPDDGLANSTTSDAQAEPAVAILPTGDFLIAWSDASETGLDASGSAVRARLFDSRGEAVSTADFVVNQGWTTWEQYEPSVAAVETPLPDDTTEAGFVVAWTSMEETGRLTIRANFVSELGGVDPMTEIIVPGSGPVDPESEPTDPAQSAPTVTSAAGGLIAAWVHDGPGDPPVADTSSSAIVGTRMAVDCSPDASCRLDVATPDTLLNTTVDDTQETPSAAFGPDGALVLVFTDWSGEDGSGGLDEVRARYLPRGWVLDAGGLP